MQIVTPRCPEICQSVAMCKNSMIFCFANWSSFDVKCNNLSFGDPNWMIIVEEETLEPYLQMSRRKY